jgi:hypothetical protein
MGLCFRFKLLAQKQHAFDSGSVLLEDWLEVQNDLFPDEPYAVEHLQRLTDTR